MTDMNWWSVPCFALAAYNLVLLYSLGAPLSGGSRAARTFGMMACLLAIFSAFEPQLQATFLSELSYLVLFASYTAQNTQFLIEERKWQRRVEPTRAHEKIVAAMVQPSSNHRETAQ